MPKQNNSKRIKSDTAWKEVLDEFYHDFIEYCLPELNKQIDWGKGITSLDKEFYAIAKDNLTGTSIVDKLVKVYLNSGQEQWVLIHVEVQGKPEDTFQKRMFIYAYRIYDCYQQPIISCAILTDAQKNWRPSHYEVAFFGSKMRLDFLTIKLTDYRTQIAELEASNNPFASVILIQLAALDAKKQKLPSKKRYNIKYQLTRRLYAKGFCKDAIRKLYLFIDWLVHLPKSLEKNILRKFAN